VTGRHWQKLLDVIEGWTVEPLPVGFIIDSPWLPNWFGISIMDYFNNEKLWLQANLKAVQALPDIIFLPGFWAEFGMCTEPSAFGAKCIWPENEFPSVEKLLTDPQQIEGLTKPDPKTAGLCPSVIKRLQQYQSDIQHAGHQIKFAVSRGPLNIASFLMGTTEFLTTLKTHPESIQKLLQLITDFIIDWIELQIETFSTIDGIFILDDIVGFLGQTDFEQMAKPYLKKIFTHFDVAVKFFHNDSQGLVCAPHLEETGVNLFNFSFEHSINEMKKLTNNNVTLLGNIPPRNILADGTPQQVSNAVKTLLHSLTDKTRIILSCGGGMPPGVSTENINAFRNALEN
jgi:uroporphyrinogen-III decarboxylase